MKALILAGLVALLLVSCGDKDDKPTDVDPAQVVKDAATAAAEAMTSFHFKLKHENGTTPLPLNLQLVSAEGDAAKPDKLAATIEAKAAAITATVKIVGIGDETWITNPFTRQFQKLDGVTVRDFADPVGLTQAVTQNLTGAVFEGKESIDGTETYHVSGKVDTTALSKTITFADPGREVTVDLWIAISDSLPRKVRIAGPLNDSEAEKVVRQLDFSKFNQPVDIQPPS